MWNVSIFSYVWALDSTICHCEPFHHWILTGGDRTLGKGFKVYKLTPLLFTLYIVNVRAFWPASLLLLPPCCLCLLFYLSLQDRLHSIENISQKELFFNCFLEYFLQNLESTIQEISHACGKHCYLIFQVNKKNTLFSIGRIKTNILLIV